jgi:hypothetical protein
MASRMCPFPDAVHVPPGPHVVRSRLALRRHMVLKHQADLMSYYDAAGRRFDQVVSLTGDELCRKTDVFRRAQRHQNKGVVAAANCVMSVSCSSVRVATVGQGPVVSDGSAGMDDFCMSWDGDELLDLFNASSNWDAGALASAVVTSVQLPVDQTFTSVPTGQESFAYVAGTSSLDMVGDAPVDLSSSARDSNEVGTLTDGVSKVDVECMTDRPVLPGYFVVADAVASLAVAGPPMGITRLAFRAADVLGVDHSNEEAMARITAAAAATLRMERLLADGLMRTAAFAVVQDPSGLSSLASLTADLGTRRCRRLESDFPSDSQDESKSLLALEEPAIVIDDVSDVAEE